MTNLQHMVGLVKVFPFEALDKLDLTSTGSVCNEPLLDRSCSSGMMSWIYCNFPFRTEYSTSFMIYEGDLCCGEGLATNLSIRKVAGLLQSWEGFFIFTVHSYKTIISHSHFLLGFYVIAKYNISQNSVE